jgi:transcriptional regulator with XRE-family HTH domain
MGVAPRQRCIGQTAPVPRLSLPTWRPDLLRTARLRKGWTIGQLAATADIGFSAASAYAEGRAAPPPPVLVRLASVLDVATTDLAPLSAQPRLAELRWHAGHTVASLAAELGLTPGYTGHVLRGEMRVTDPIRWAAALSITIDQLDRAWHAARADLDQRH